MSLQLLHSAMLLVDTRTRTKLTITVRNIVIPAAVCMTVDCLDSQSVREPISSHTGEGHTATHLIQPRHRIVYQRRRNTSITWTLNISYKCVVRKMSQAICLQVISSVHNIRVMCNDDVSFGYLDSRALCGSRFRRAHELLCIWYSLCSFRHQTVHCYHKSWPPSQRSQRIRPRSSSSSSSVTGFSDTSWLPATYIQPLHREAVNRIRRCQWKNNNMLHDLLWNFTITIRYSTI